ncbi:MAG: hypothetical protein R2682_05280 [Pyrinomonadaceae bacterium]
MPNSFFAQIAYRKCRAVQACLTVVVSQKIQACFFRPTPNHGVCVRLCHDTGTRGEKDRYDKLVPLKRAHCSRDDARRPNYYECQQEELERYKTQPLLESGKDAEDHAGPAAMKAAPVKYDQKTGQISAGTSGAVASR